MIYKTSWKNPANIDSLNKQPLKVIIELENYDKDKLSEIIKLN